MDKCLIFTVELEEDGMSRCLLPHALGFVAAGVWGRTRAFLNVSACVLGWV